MSARRVSVAALPPQVAEQADGADAVWHGRLRDLAEIPGAPAAALDRDPLRLAYLVLYGERATLFDARDGRHIPDITVP